MARNKQKNEIDQIDAESSQENDETASDGANKMDISFTLGRNKAVIVLGTYDHDKTSVSERMKFWEIIQNFGGALVEELATNHMAAINKVVLCEVDLGNIIFEVETNANASIRKKAILAVQENIGGEAPNDGFAVHVPVFGPDGAQ